MGIKKYRTKWGNSVEGPDSDGELEISTEYYTEDQDVYLTKTDLIEMLKMFEEEK